jgi:hypothetical protein
LKKTIKNSKIKLLENQIAKVALSLKIIPGEMVIDSNVKKQKNSQKKSELFGEEDGQEGEDFEEEPEEEKLEEGELDVFDENNLA